jgi:SAM-dependent methyltransferase
VKPRLLDLLACPRCDGELTLAPAPVVDGEVLDGHLTCQECAQRYPIVRGIPRFVTDASYADSFGYEWRRFRTVQLDSLNCARESEMAFAAKTGWTAQDLSGRLVLDAGVGAGRYADVVARWGGEVVGVDISGAVDAAFESIGQHPHVHLIQADLFALPLRPEAFDFVYSIGVLHHTPSPARAFASIGRLVRKSGQLAVYVYPAGGLAARASDALRAVTTRLPRSLLYWACAAAVPLYFVHRLPWVGRLLRLVLPISLHPRWRWRWLDTFDWYSPRFQSRHTYPEVLGWFRADGYTDLYASREAICLRGVKA